MLLFYGRKNPGGLTASGRVSMTIWSRLGLDHQAQISLFDRMKTSHQRSQQGPQIESPFSVSWTLGFAAAGGAAPELLFFRNRGEIVNKHWPCPSVCICQIPKINRNPKLA